MQKPGWIPVEPVQPRLGNLVESISDLIFKTFILIQIISVKFILNVTKKNIHVDQK